MSERPDNPELNLAAAYALGILSPEEARSFEQVLATSEAARREVAEYREVSALLALESPDAVPPAALRNKVLARVGLERVIALPAPPPPARPALLPWLAAAAALIAAVGLGWSLQRSRAELASRDQAIASLRTELAAREQTLSAREATLNAILEPGVKLSVLISATTAKPAMQMFVNQSRGIAIANAVNLPALATGRTYQLWFIPKAGKPIASVTFNSESTGRALVQNIALPPGTVLTAAAITEEPAGGSAQPTSAIILSGAL